MAKYKSKETAFNGVWKELTFKSSADLKDTKHSQGVIEANKIMKDFLGEERERSHIKNAEKVQQKFGEFKNMIAINILNNGSNDYKRRKRNTAESMMDWFRYITFKVYRNKQGLYWTAMLQPLNANECKPVKLSVYKLFHLEDYVINYYKTQNKL